MSSPSPSSSTESSEIFFTLPSTSSLLLCLKDESAPIAKRMRSVFLLKQIGDDECIVALTLGISSPSILLAHECAYVLGQLQNPIALPSLQKYLSDENVNPIVRHECAEAIAAIGDIHSIDILKSFCDDKVVEVRDTCRISVEKLEWKLNHKAQEEKEKVNPTESKYYSVDPAPPTVQTKSVAEHLSLLLDTNLSLFSRYRSMFSLRDDGSEEAIIALCKGFKDESAVFRHEIAYVLGQMQHPLALKELNHILSNPNEHAMVRHEAAEAIGSIAEESSADFLGKFRNDSDKIVKESCDVALDLVEYWNNDEVCTAVAEKEEKEQGVGGEAEKQNEKEKSPSSTSVADGITVQPYVRRAKPAVVAK